jgi:hypothetical protein
MIPDSFSNSFGDRLPRQLVPRRNLRNGQVGFVCGFDHIKLPDGGQAAAPVFRHLVKAREIIVNRLLCGQG